MRGIRSGLEHDTENGWLDDWTKSVLSCLSAKDIKECASIIADYSKYNLWRKPEVQVPGLFNYHEMMKLNDLWQSIMLRCEVLKERRYQRRHRMPSISWSITLL